ncbi:hypothetical protein OAB57_03740 [Bacteriovoracaceae bacterium]|nr:hypothetical protein [Bacteriovoracaceae bacterium]
MMEQQNEVSEVNGNYGGTKIQIGGFLGFSFWSTYFTLSYFTEDTLTFDKQTTSGQDLAYVGTGYLGKMSHNIGPNWGVSVYFAETVYDKYVVGEVAAQTSNSKSTASSYGVGLFFSM